MKFFTKNKEKYEKDDNFLLYIPKKKHNTWEVKNGKVLLIFHHRKKAERFLRWLVNKPTISDVELDEMGSKVWLSIDGNNSVYDIGVILQQTFGKKCDPVYDRLIMFMRHLVKKGWISFDIGDQ